MPEASNKLAKKLFRIDGKKGNFSEALEKLFSKSTIDLIYRPLTRG